MFTYILRWYHEWEWIWKSQYILTYAITLEFAMAAFQYAYDAQWSTDNNKLCLHKLYIQKLNQQSFDVNTFPNNISSQNKIIKIIFQNRDYSFAHNLESITKIRVYIVLHIESVVVHIITLNRYRYTIFATTWHKNKQITIILLKSTPPRKRRLSPQRIQHQRNMSKLSRTITNRMMTNINCKLAQKPISVKLASASRTRPSDRKQWTRLLYWIGIIQQKCFVLYIANGIWVMCEMQTWLWRSQCVRLGEWQSLSKQSIENTYVFSC